MQPIPSTLTFLLKVLGSSTAIAIAIKYGGPLLALTPSVSLSLVLVLAPFVGLAGWLWRHNF
jgi:hypothetical protein